MLQLPRRSCPFLAIATGALVAVAVLAACSSGHSARQQAAPTTSAPVKSVRPLRLGDASVESAGPAVQLDARTKRAVLAAAQAYVDAAVYTPLDTGAVDAAFGALFDDAVRPAATTTDRGALTDLAVGRASAYEATSRPVRVSALADQFGALVYLAASFRVQVKATAGTGPVTITRTVELTFTAPHKGDTLRVTAYRVQAVRRTPAATTTTSAVSGTSS